MAAVVPLLSHFPVSEHDSSSRSLIGYLNSSHGLCHAQL